MKSKKPFLIFCAAALTLAFALPFMGVFAFASESVDFLSSSSGTLSYGIYQGSSWDASVSSGVSLPINRLSLDIVCWMRFQSGSSYPGVAYVSGSDSPVTLSTSSSSPTSINISSLSYFTSASGTYTNNNLFYFVLVEDPLAPVSDGLEASINIFGQVIDYVVNTPSVALFVALSVAAFAIVPAGIVIIKKLIKGY